MVCKVCREHKDKVFKVHRDIRVMDIKAKQEYKDIREHADLLEMKVHKDGKDHSLSGCKDFRVLSVSDCKDSKGKLEFKEARDCKDLAFRAAKEQLAQLVQQVRASKVQ